MLETKDLAQNAEDCTRAMFTPLARRSVPREDSAAKGLGMSANGAKGRLRSVMPDMGVSSTLGTTEMLHAHPRPMHTLTDTQKRCGSPEGNGACLD